MSTWTRSLIPIVTLGVALSACYRSHLADGVDARPPERRDGGRDARIDAGRDARVDGGFVRCEPFDVVCADLPSGPTVTGCREVPRFCTSGAAGCRRACAGGFECRRLSEQVRDLALATNGTDTALVWISEDGPGGARRANFARLDSSLGVVSVNACYELSSPSQVAVARARGGWALAIAGGDGSSRVQLQLLDLNGTVRGDPVDVGSGSHPFMAARPRGGPLLGWITGDGQVQVMLVDDGCTPATPPVTLFGGVAGRRFRSATFREDSFLVSARSVSSVTVARVCLDGRPSGGVQTPGGDSTEYPSLTWDGRQTWYTYTDFGETPSGVRLVPLDELGQVSGSVQRLGDIPEFFNATPLASRDGTSFALLGGYTGCTGQSDRVSLISIRGGTAGPPTDLSPDGFTITGWRLATDERGLVAAWIEGGSCSSRDGPGGLVVGRFPADL